MQVYHVLKTALLRNARLHQLAGCIENINPLNKAVGKQLFKQRRNTVLGENPPSPFEQ